jgi:hypothetical protein
MNIDPKVWGKSGWIFLHSITFSYPDNPSPETKQIYKEFFLKVGKILPCEKCRYNYDLHLQKYPLDNSALFSHDSLITWLINIRNEVNAILDKNYVTIDDVVEEMEQAKNKTSKYKYLCLILIAIIAIIVIIVGYKIYKKGINFMSSY